MMLLAAVVFLAAAPAVPSGDWLTEESGLLELKLAHQERDRPDGGILRIDGLRRLVLWEGIPGDLGCRQRIEAPFETVKSVRAARTAGFTLELHDGRKLTFLPLPHAAWFAKQTQVNQGDFARVAREADLTGPDGRSLPLSGSAASTAPRVERIRLPDDVAFDVRRAVTAVREALGRQEAPGSVLREALHGAAVDVALAELLEAPTPFEGRAVRVRGRLTAGHPQGGAHQLTDDATTITVMPAPEIATVVASQVSSWNGEEVEVTGVFRRDPVVGRAAYSIVFWEFAAPERVAARDAFARRTTLAALVQDGSTEPVRVVGRFRGRNLYGDLPGATARRGDWVIKEGGQAAWVHGRPPRGQGWVLDPENAEDTRNWVEVVARAENHNGVLRLRAESVALVAPPGGAHVRPGLRVNVTRAIAPVVVFALPVEGEPVKPDGRLIVQFNKYMDEDTFPGRVRLRYADGGDELRSVKLTYDDSRRALIIDPGDRLQAGRKVECVLLPGIADADGVPLSPRAGHEAPEGAVDVLRFDVGF
ncbi:MAG TPA: Ig-like domain-containing protein [Vicinamibacteria bacterium]|nr:Ig-like domain-containing protein [Vicinamibacteria bacterium]